MLKVNVDQRISTEDILKNKIMVLRNQDYNMRGQLANMKFKNEANTKQIEEINENIVK